MQDLMNHLWEMSQPVMLMLFGSLLIAVIAWGTNAIHKSAWYQRQPWVVKKAVDIALEIAVKRLQPQAKQFRDSNFGKIQSQDADMLHAAAVQDAMETIRKDNPKIARAIPSKILEAKVALAVPKVVEKVKAKEKKRRANPNQPGGAGRHP